MTSSTSAGSSAGALARTCRIACAARSSGRVSLNDPRCDLASGVRLLATMTASLIQESIHRPMATSRLPNVWHQQKRRRHDDEVDHKEDREISDDVLELHFRDR